MTTVYLTMCLFHIPGKESAIIFVFRGRIKKYRNSGADKGTRHTRDNTIKSTSYSRHDFASLLFIIIEKYIIDADFNIVRTRVN